MIHAELKGKLGKRGELAHDRLEDLLTSNVFGVLRYLPVELGILPFLKQVRSPKAPEETGALPIDLDDVAEVEWFFWPRAGRVGECDVLLVLKDGSGQEHGVLVEAKLGSGKSSKEAVDEDDAEQGDEDELEEQEIDDERIGDQLAKYLGALHKGGFKVVDGRRFATRCIIYLTAHAGMPMKSLEDSYTAAKKHGVPAAFFWLSWSDLDRALRPLAGLGTCENQHAMDDLLGLLKQKRLQAFWGMHSPRIVFPDSFRGGRWESIQLEALPVSWRRRRARWGAPPEMPRSWRGHEVKGAR